MNVVVIGAGIAGLSAAIALARSGHHVIVLEAHQGLHAVGAGIQMPPNATKIFRDWGILPKILEKASVPNDVCFRSYRDGEILHKQSLWPDTQTNFGSPHVQIHRRELVQILLDEAIRLNVNVQFDSPVESVKSPVVKTIHGEPFHADLIIGADGERSLCRSIILGQATPLRPTGTLVYRFNISCELILQDDELSRLFKFPILCSWLGPDAHAVMYSLDHNDTIMVAITYPDPVQGRVQLGPRGADMAELKGLLSGWDPILLKLMDIGEDLKFWTLAELPEENRIWMDSESQRIILVGDAAHSMAPYLAQGASQSIEDGAFLGHLFPKDSRSEDTPKRLQQFCNRRQERTLAVRTKAQLVGNTFQLPDGLAQEARDDHMRRGDVTSGFPNPFADPNLQKWLYAYDVEADAAAALAQLQA
ncbi:FAD/NAD(P)-binding domain-containing protein [Paramyrothecium foliicola]|nr:FAD/NAD(P)-binding domain-containing protein [Paramyrothecium foliicola]